MNSKSPPIPLDFALVFPGQGVHNERMINVIRSLACAKRSKEKYNVVCDALGRDPLDTYEKKGIEYLVNNEVSSILTVFSSILLLEEYKNIMIRPPKYLAGYSVGQWTALYASGVLEFEQLINLLMHRAELMNECFVNVHGAMLSVIGVNEEDILKAIEPIARKQYVISISNYNCIGQHTVSGEKKAIDIFYASMAIFKPKKMVYLPVQGAWHTSLLRKASIEFKLYLANMCLKKQLIPIVDNVTGKLLPNNYRLLCNKLASHIDQPVRWLDSVKFVVNNGCGKVVEVGHGNMLTKFGLYIDRKIEHISVMEELEV